MEFEGMKYIALGLILFIAIFLVCREIVTWYFKIDKMIKILAEIRDGLKKNNEEKDDEIKEKEFSKSQLTPIEKETMEKYLKITEKERRESCFACEGKNPSCALCNSREIQINRYIESKK